MATGNALFVAYAPVAVTVEAAALDTATPPTDQVLVASAVPSWAVKVYVALLELNLLTKTSTGVLTVKVFVATVRVMFVASDPKAETFPNANDATLVPFPDVRGTPAAASVLNIRLIDPLTVAETDNVPWAVLPACAAANELIITAANKIIISFFMVPPQNLLLFQDLYFSKTDLPSRSTAANIKGKINWP
jgi:hypothetical protein